MTRKRKQKRPTKELRHFRFWRVHFEGACTSLTKGGGFRAAGDDKEVTRENIRRHLDWAAKGEPDSPYVSVFASQGAAETRAAHHASGGQETSVHEFQTTLKISFVKAKKGKYDVFLPVWRAGKMFGGVWKPMCAKGAKEVLFLETAAMRCYLDVPKQESDFEEWLVMGEVLAAMKVRSWEWTEGKGKGEGMMDGCEDAGVGNSDDRAEDLGGPEDEIDGRIMKVAHRPKASSSRSIREGKTGDASGFASQIDGKSLEMAHSLEPSGGRRKDTEVPEETGPIVMLGDSDAEDSSEDGEQEGGGGGFRLI